MRPLSELCSVAPIFEVAVFNNQMKATEQYITVQSGSNIYSEMSSTGATRGLSANQSPILKQRNEHADLMGNCRIFLIG